MRRPPGHGFEGQFNDHKAAIALANIIRPLRVAKRPSGSVPTYVQKAWRLEFAGGHGKKLIAKSIS
jgi:hypothetical protein